MFPFASKSEFPVTWIYPDAVRLVFETFRSEEEETVKIPVPVATENNALEVAVPPSCPKRSCPFTQAVELGRDCTVSPVDVTYLLPFKSKIFCDCR